MADKKKQVPGNVPGDFFVDTTCIGCGNCRDLAPDNFAKIGSYFAVVKQPETEQQFRETMEALVCCPRGAIGTHERHNVKPVLDSFPEQIGDGVYYLGFNSPASAGGKSYFITHSSGNWMIDSPKYSPRLVKWIEDHGGIKYIFLTHRDDVAEAHQYAAKFGAKRIMHREDLEAQPDAEVVIHGIDEVNFDNAFVVIPQPGHTEGHCMLLFYNKYLFSGDVLTSQYRFDDPLEAWPPFYCWFSWSELTRSLERLKHHRFEWVLPAHGRRVHKDAEEMQRCLHMAIDRCKRESDPDPCTPERIAMFEHIAAMFAEAKQPLYAEDMRQRADRLKARLAGMVSA